MFSQCERNSAHNVEDKCKRRRLIIYNFLFLIFQLDTLLLEAKVIGFHGLVMKVNFVMLVGTGSPVEITAVKCAWTWLVSKRRLNKISLRGS